jgi:hypothetical protein
VVGGRARLHVDVGVAVLLLLRLHGSAQHLV